jgi:hypothetical protein
MFKLVKDNTEYYVRAELADMFRCKLTDEILFEVELYAYANDKFNGDSHNIATYTISNEGGNVSNLNYEDIGIERLSYSNQGLWLLYADEKHFNNMNIYEYAEWLYHNEHKPNKFVRLEGSECVLGYISTIDNSTSDYVRLYNDKHNIFQMEILNGSDRAYSFVANCTELFDILRDNFIGTTMSDIASRLADNNYITL